MEAGDCGQFRDIWGTLEGQTHLELGGIILVEQVQEFGLQPDSKVAGYVR